MKSEKLEKLEVRVEKIPKSNGILLILILIFIIITYVQSMVVPGIPIIQNDLSISSTTASWISSMVLFVGAIASPLFGKLGDNYDKNKLIIVCFIGYTVGIIIASFSQTIEVLLIARAIQGLGWAIIPLSFALLSDIFPKQKVATAQGILMGMTAIGLVLGFILGSFIIENFGWRYTFYSAAIVSVILSILIIFIFKPKASPKGNHKIDFGGAILLSFGIGLILLYMTEGPSLGWVSIVELVFLISGLIFLVSFFIVESKITEPLINVNLLKIRNVLFANIITIVAGIANYIIFFLVIYYGQLPNPHGLGLNVQDTGILLAPASIAVIIVGFIAGKTLNKIGPGIMILVGASITILGFLLFGFFRGNSMIVAIDVVITFIGIVILTVLGVNLISVSLPSKDISIGQGLNNCLRTIGLAMGPIIATTILTSFTEPLIMMIMGFPVVVGDIPTANAFNIVAIISIILLSICIILSFIIKKDSKISIK